MTLEQIRMFVTVAEAGSITQAAMQLHKTQSAISIAIKRLQEEFNLALLHKAGNRLQLTDAGRRFLPRCQYMLKQQTDLTILAHHLSDGYENTFELAYDSLCPRELIYSPIIQAQKQFSQTEFLLTLTHRLSAVPRVRDGLSDIAVAPWLPNFSELVSLETAVLKHFEVIAVTHANNIKHFDTALTQSQQLYHLPLILPQSFEIEVDIEQVIGLIPKFSIRTNDADSKCDLLRQGIGWGYISRDLIQEDLVSGTLIELALDDITSKIQGEIRVIRKANQPLGPVGEYIWQQFLAMSL